MPNLLVIDPYNNRLTSELTQAVQDAGLTVTPINLEVDPEAVARYRLGHVPCVARLHNGEIVFATQTPALIEEFDTVADAKAADRDAYLASLRVAP